MPTAAFDLSKLENDIKRVDLKVRRGVQDGTIVDEMNYLTPFIVSSELLLVGDELTNVNF